MEHKSKFLFQFATINQTNLSNFQSQFRLFELNCYHISQNKLSMDTVKIYAKILPALSK